MQSKITTYLPFKQLLTVFLVVFSLYAHSQSNKKTKDKEIKQVEEINKDYDRPALKKKRQDYLSQTREQRLGRGKIKGKSKAQKEREYIDRSVNQRTSSGDVQAKSKSRKETEYINKTANQRSFKGDQKKPKDNTKSLAKEIKNAASIKGETPQKREYQDAKRNLSERSFTGRNNANKQQHLAKREENKNTMSKYSTGDIQAKTKGEKEADYVKRSSGTRQHQGRIKESNLQHLAKREENKQTMEKYSTGDIKYQTRGEKEADYVKRTKGIREHQGRIKEGNLQHLAKREENKQEMEKYATGDIRYQTKGQKEADYVKRTSGMRNFQGRIDRGNLQHLAKKEENKKEMEKYNVAGNLKYMTKGQKEAAYLERTKGMRTYQGNIDRGNLAHLSKRAEIKDEMDKYATGDISLRDLDKRAKQRRQKAKKIAAFSGSIRTKDLEKWRKNIRKKEKDIANFTGNIRVAKRKKEQHPSAAYRGGKVVNSYSKKEKLRKKMLKKYGRKGDVDMPRHLKEQQRKPKYSKDESEIWW